MQRRAEKRCSHNKAPRGSLSACSTAAVRSRTFRRLGHGELHGCLASLVLRPQPSGTYCVFRIVCSFGPTAGGARHPENLGGHTAIAFHPSSDWMRRLARSVINWRVQFPHGQPLSRLFVAVFPLLLLSSSSSILHEGRGRRYLPSLESADVPRPAILIQIIRRQWRCPVPACLALACLVSGLVRFVALKRHRSVSDWHCMGRLHQKQNARKGCFLSLSLSLFPGGLWISLFSGIRGVRPSPF